MEFGRVQKIDNIDFSLPPDPAMTQRVLDATRKDNAPLRVYVGGTSWGQTRWLGKVYPRGTKPTDFLAHYARQFNSIELNALWYNLQPKAVIERWAALAGPAFLQLTESFGPARAGALQDFLRGLPRDFMTCVELRNEGWYGTSAVRETWELLFGLGIGAVITDTPGRRDVLHMRLTAPVAFVRFVGNHFHAKDRGRIDEWGERLANWVERGLREVYFFVHDTGELFSPEMCGYAVEVFNRRFGAGLKAPQLIPEEPTAGDLKLF